MNEYLLGPDPIDRDKLVLQLKLPSRSEAKPTFSTKLFTVEHADFIAPSSQHLGSLGNLLVKFLFHMTMECCVKK